MTSLSQYGHIKPTSNRFEEYLDDLKAHWRLQKVRPQRVHAAIALLRELERSRICFSALNDKSFATKNISNKALAERLGYQTTRQVQKLRQWLEEQGILSVIRPKLNRFFNGWNRYEFARFKEWFIARFQQPARKTGHPIKENDQRSLFTKPTNNRISFPTNDLSSYGSRSRFWIVIANEVPKAGEQLPCLASLSQKFRINLIQHRIPFDDKSIIPRWKAFVRKAIEFQQPQGLAP